MIKSIVIIGVIACLLFLPSVAGAISVVDGSLDDWLGSGATTSLASAGDDWVSWYASNANPVSGIWWDNDGQQPDGGSTEGPGYGGQDYDIEAFGAVVESDVLYFAMVTGWDPWGTPDYPAGDVFFDIADIIVEEGLYNMAVNVQPGDSSYSDVYASTVPPFTLETVDVQYGAHSASNPYRVDLDEEDAETTQATVTWTQLAANRNLLELSLDLTDYGFSWTETSGLDVHWTMYCGNDNFNVNWTSTDTRKPDIPEPASVALLGLGLIGAILRKKFSA